MTKVNVEDIDPSCMVLVAAIDDGTGKVIGYWVVWK